MHVILEKKMPNGSIAAKHTLNNVVIRDNTVAATVMSYTSDDVVCWNEVREIPYSAISTDPLMAVLVYLTSIGNYLANGAITQKLSDLDTTRLGLMKTVDRIRELKVNSGCQSPSGLVQTDDVSIRNILGSVQTASLSVMLNQPFAIDWRLADNTLVSLDANQMIAMGVAVMQHIKFCYTKSWQLKDELTNATTLQELQAVAINDGWAAA